MGTPQRLQVFSTGSLPGIGGVDGPGLYLVDYTARRATFLSTVPLKIGGDQIVTYLVAASDASAKARTVADYLCTGTNDDVLINTALSALPAAGGKVVLSEGHFVTGNMILLPADNMILSGSGWNTVIKPVSNATFDVISTPIPVSSGTPGYQRNYIGIENLMIDCSLMNGTVTGQGNGIHFYGVHYAYIHNVFVTNCDNWAILLDGDATNFSYNNEIRECIFDLNNAGIQCNFSEANNIVDNQFKWAGAATLAQQPAFPSRSTTAMHLWLTSGYGYVSGNVFGNGGAYTLEAIRLANAGPCRIIGNRFDIVRYIAINLSAGNHIVMGNQIGNPSSIGSTVGIQIGSSNNIIIGNKFDNTNGAINYTYAIGESGGPFSGNIIQGNNLLIGTTGFIFQNAASTNVIGHNPGYNPVGHAVAQPAVPASTVAQTNNSGVDCTVFVTGGTISAITVSGSATGLTTTPATVRVPTTGTIAITYSVAPSWSWFGD